MPRIDPVPGRPLPATDDTDEFFWTSGADDTLRMQRCGACDLVVHPPGPRCPRCLSADLAPRAMLGTGRVASFTVNHQPWTTMAVPYVVAIIELDDQEGLHLTSNVRGCDLEAISIGTRVRVAFERHERLDHRDPGLGNSASPVFVPVFVPVTGPGEEELDYDDRG
jgi:uncharacterized OB-fold protein